MHTLRGGVPVHTLQECLCIPCIMLRSDAGLCMLQKRQNSIHRPLRLRSDAGYAVLPLPYCVAMPFYLYLIACPSGHRRGHGVPSYGRGLGSTAVLWPSYGRGLGSTVLSLTPLVTVSPCPLPPAHNARYWEQRRPFLPRCWPALCSRSSLAS